MTFNIKEVAFNYVEKRFPNASKKEKEKIVKDWESKVAKSQDLVKDFIDRVENPKGKKIIDVGSGPGGVSIAFAQAGAQITGVDIEEDLYKISKNHAEFYGVYANFVLYDGVKLPFKDNHFDHAISVSVIEHVDNPVLYLSEIYRVIKPGGMLYLGFPNKFWPKETHTQVWFLTYFPYFIKKIIIKILNRNPIEANNLHFYSYFDLKNMLKKLPHGEFVIVKETGKSNNVFKKLIRSVLDFINIPYKTLLPHILLILKK